MKSDINAEPWLVNQTAGTRHPCSMPVAWIEVQDILAIELTRLTLGYRLTIPFRFGWDPFLGSHLDKDEAEANLTLDCAELCSRDKDYDLSIADGFSIPSGFLGRAPLSTMFITPLFNALSYERKNNQHLPKTVSRDGVNGAISLALSPYDLEALEKSRDGGDLSLSLRVFGSLFIHQGLPGVPIDNRSTVKISASPVCFNIPAQVWAAKMIGARASIVSVHEQEILPVKSQGKPSSIAENAIRRATEQFLTGDYRGCIGTCRDVLDPISKKLGSVTNSKTGNNGKKSRKDEDSIKDRIQDMLASMLRVTQCGHHPEISGSDSLARIESKLILILAINFLEMEKAGYLAALDQSRDNQTESTVPGEKPQEAKDASSPS